MHKTMIVRQEPLAYHSWRGGMVQRLIGALGSEPQPAGNTADASRLSRWLQQLKLHTEAFRSKHVALVISHNSCGRVVFGCAALGPVALCI